MMINDQDMAVRAQAMQAASTIASTIGMSDPGLVLQVAYMMETYIKQGISPAQKVIDSWSTPASQVSPQTQGASRGNPNISRAQELANQAQAASSFDQVKGVQAAMREERLNEEIVNIEGVGGTLESYLGHRLSGFPDPGGSLRSDLGL